MRVRATDLAKPHWASWSTGGSWLPPATWLWSMWVRATDLARPHWAAWGRSPPWSAVGSWSPPATWLWSKGGQANFYLQSANPQFLDSLFNRKSANFVGVPGRKSQIRKFLWLIRKSQIRKFLINIGQLCLKTVLKVVFVSVLFKYIWIRRNMN